MTKLACVARWGLALIAGVGILLPAEALAQASITGVVKDSSGAVLPGVTVEASSPELIEKVRTVVTDSGGLLSHSAIVAREYGIPGVVGTRSATDRIADGARVRVDGNAGEVTVLG